jgi:PAS domain S-box-containing protein
MVVLRSAWSSPTRVAADRTALIRARYPRSSPESGCPRSLVTKRRIIARSWGGGETCSRRLPRSSVGGFHGDLRNLQVRGATISAEGSRRYRDHSLIVTADLTAPVFRIIVLIRDELCKLVSTESKTAGSVDRGEQPAFVMDGSGMVIQWSTQAEELFGWTDGEAIGRRLSELLIPERHRASHEAGLRRFMQGASEGTLLNRPLDITVLHRDGHEFNLPVRIDSQANPTGRRFPAYVTRP